MSKTNLDVEETVLQIISTFTYNESSENITCESRLKSDLGIDSLSMLEMCVKIKGEFGISIENSLESIESIADIISYIEHDSQNGRIPEYRIEDYPLAKTLKQLNALKRLMKWTNAIWRINATGVDNVLSSRNYIICPNHISTFDGLWVWTALGFDNINPEKICELAKHEFLKGRFTGIGMTLLGGIPIDRKGNPLPAMLRCIKCLKEENYSLVIHPEGTVTRDGKIQEFKGGAAKIAIDSDVDIIPVLISGVTARVKNGLALPRLFDWKRLRRQRVNISFGKAISPKERTVDELTSIIRVAIEDLKNG